jgi:signal transduction histidine kinase
LPFFIQFNFIPADLAISADRRTVFLGQLLLSTTFIALLITVNGYSIIRQQREEVIASLEKHISGERYSSSITKGGEAQRNSDLANYLHGEIQAGLTASSLLLQQAAKSGDSDLAHEALERASGLLNQDLTNISYTRMATPEVKIKKIVDAWKGIAEISVSLPSFDLISESALRSSVQLIEEAVANSIRHARANDIKVSGVLKNELLTITIISNGDPMTKGKAGLGTKMFNDLSAEWDYAAESGHNRLTFTLVN